jgi:hypothetical protein
MNIENNPLTFKCGLNYIFGVCKRQFYISYIGIMMKGIKKWYFVRAYGNRF